MTDKLLVAERKNTVEEGKLLKRKKYFDQERRKSANFVAQKTRTVKVEMTQLHLHTGSSEHATPARHNDNRLLKQSQYFKFGPRLSEERLTSWQRKELQLQRFLADRRPTAASADGGDDEDARQGARRAALALLRPLEDSDSEDEKNKPRPPSGRAEAKAERSALSGCSLRSDGSPSASGAPLPSCFRLAMKSDADGEPSASEVIKSIVRRYVSDATAPVKRAPRRAMSACDFRRRESESSSEGAAAAASSQRPLPAIADGTPKATADTCRVVAASRLRRLSSDGSSAAPRLSALPEELSDSEQCPDRQPALRKTQKLTADASKSILKVKETKTTSATDAEAECPTAHRTAVASTVPPLNEPTAPYGGCSGSIRSPVDGLLSGKKGLDAAVAQLTAVETASADLENAPVPAANAVHNSEALPPAAEKTGLFKWKELSKRVIFAQDVLKSSSDERKQEAEDASAQVGVAEGFAAPATENPAVAESTQRRGKGFSLFSVVKSALKAEVLDYASAAGDDPGDELGRQAAGGLARRRESAIPGLLEKADAAKGKSSHVAMSASARKREIERLVTERSSDRKAIVVSERQRRLESKLSLLASVASLMKGDGADGGDTAGAW